MIFPRRAPVRPRVLSPATNETVLLEDLIGSCVEQRPYHAVEIMGGPRSGKTTALAHLASLALANGLTLVDDAQRGDLHLGGAERLIVYTTRRQLDCCDLRCELVPWRDDDLIEYLLSTHPDRCSSVMARYTADGNRGLLAGKPELYCMVAEQFAGSECVHDLRTALRQGIAERAVDPQTLEDARFLAAALLLKEEQLAEGRSRQMRLGGVDPELFCLLAYRWVQILLTADRVLSVLKECSRHPFPTHKLPRELVMEISQLAEREPAVMLRLQELMESGEADYVPMVASVLHFADPQWRPSRDVCSYLPGAYLSNARWKSIDLSEVNLQLADLRRCDLRHANLEGARLVKAILRGSKLSGVCMAGVRAYRADFTDADLTDAEMTGGRFGRAFFAGSVMNHVFAEGANFQRADLRGASLHQARLSRCDFREALLDGADFQDADMRGVDLSEQNLRQTVLRGSESRG